MLHIHPTKIHVGFSHSVSVSLGQLLCGTLEPYPWTPIVPLGDFLSLLRRFAVPQEGLWENTLFHGAMTVVTNESGKRGDLNRGLRFKGYKKIRFLWQNFRNNTEMLFHSCRPGGLLEKNIKQFKSSIDHVYIFLGSSKKANVQSGLFNLAKLCSNPKHLHLMWKIFIKPPEKAGPPHFLTKSRTAIFIYWLVPISLSSLPLQAAKAAQDDPPVQRAGEVSPPDHFKASHTPSFSPPTARTDPTPIPKAPSPALLL